MSNQETIKKPKTRNTGSIFFLLISLFLVLTVRVFAQTGDDFYLESPTSVPQAATQESEEPSPTVSPSIIRTTTEPATLPQSIYVSDRAINPSQKETILASPYTNQGFSNTTTKFLYRLSLVIAIVGIALSSGFLSLFTPRKNKRKKEPSNLLDLSFSKETDKS